MNILEVEEKKEKFLDQFQPCGLKNPYCVVWLIQQPVVPHLKSLEIYFATNLQQFMVEC